MKVIYDASQIMANAERTSGSRLGFRLRYNMESMFRQQPKGTRLRDSDVNADFDVSYCKVGKKQFRSGSGRVGRPGESQRAVEDHRHNAPNASNNQ